MKATCQRASRAAAFTLVEALITITIIGIMTALVISAFSNAAQDTRRVVARQQQAVVQGAVNNWVSANLIGNNTVNALRATYNYSGGTTERTSVERFALVAGYLDETTVVEFGAGETYSEGSDSYSTIESSVLEKLDQVLVLPTWESGSYPQVWMKP